MDTDKKNNSGIMNWNALFDRIGYKDILIVLLAIVVIFVYLRQGSPASDSQDMLVENLTSAEKEYQKRLNDLEDGIKMSLAAVSSHLDSSATLTTDSADLVKEIESLENYLVEIENLKRVKNDLVHRVLQYDKEPYITFSDIDGEGKNIVITNNDIRVLMRFILAMTERMRDNRFDLYFEEVGKDSRKVSLLLDKSLGNVWILNEKQSRYKKLVIENLTQERQNREIDNFLELLLHKTGGYNLSVSSLKKDLVGSGSDTAR